MKIALGIPLSWPFCHSDFVDSWTLLIMDALNKGYRIEVIRSSSGDIAAMRNSIVYAAQEKNCSHLLFLDTDMIYPKDTIERLLKRDLDIVGALTFKRYPPFNPLMMKGEERKLQYIYPYDEGLVKVTATGSGCLLINMKVFDSVKKPWFEWVHDNDGPVGEDVGFCYKAGRAGFDIFVDTTVKTIHICMMGVDETLCKLNHSMMEHGRQINFLGKEA
jgi:hypothetical protein